MRYGFCMNVNEFERVSQGAKFGFDYVEVGFSGLSNADDEQYRLFADAVNKSGIRCETANGFLPKDMRVTGNHIRYDKLTDFVERGMKRGAALGLRTVVFGSSGARNLDSDTDYMTGFCQIVKFMNEVACPVAKNYGVTVVLEPLCRKESNIINTVKEGAMVAAACGFSNAGSLADIYHMYIENDGYDNIRELKDCIYHSHISYPKPDDGSKRSYMKSVDEYDYRGFIDALKFAGCESCSIEAPTADFCAEGEAAMKVLKSL